MLFLELITPDKKIFEGEITGVLVPGASGSFEVLNNHAPIISALETGAVRIHTPKETFNFQIDGGIIEVLKNKVVVLTESVTE